MDISYELLNRFARIIVGKDSSKKADANINLYGTIRVDPKTEEKQVLIDGCDSPTPIYEAMDAINGDRVLVTIKDHKATVTGNLTSPASARTASGFLKPLPTGGFIIGEIKDGDPIVAYIILKETEILFLSFDGKVMGSFSTVDTRLGHDKNSVIRLCGDTGNIKYTDEKGFIFDAKDYIEIDTKSGDHNAKIINSSKNGDPYISMELHNANTGKDASMKISDDGLDIRIPDELNAKINGKKILTSGGGSEEAVTMEMLLDLVYPVGSIYMTTKNVSPENFLGGKWNLTANGRTLVGIDTSNSAFNAAKKTGGNGAPKLPKHSHTVYYHSHSYGGTTQGGGSHAHSIYCKTRGPKGSTYRTIGTASDCDVVRTTSTAQNHSHNYSGTTSTHPNTSSSEEGVAVTSIDNYPPYFVTYIWERIA